MKLISELNDLLVAKGITFNEGTSLATKEARFVFNGNNKRITGYAMAATRQLWSRFCSRKAARSRVRR